MLINENNWHKNKTFECGECGFLHKTSRYIYFEEYSVGDVGLCYRDGLECNKCGNTTYFHIRDKRAVKILREWLKKDIDFTDEDKILRAMDDYALLIKKD
jgi:ribosomal protein S27AE